MSFKYFAQVDEYAVDPESGNLVVRNPDRSRKVVVNRPASVSPEGVSRPAVCRSVDCREDGVYVVSDKMEFFTEAMAVMQSHVAASRGKLIGPFDDANEALIARERLRPKTREESLQARIAELEAQVGGKDKAELPEFPAAESDDVAASKAIDKKNTKKGVVEL